jgi:hypothetical protein
MKTLNRQEAVMSRQEAASRAVHEAYLEGVCLDSEFKMHNQRWIDGEITIQELIDLLKQAAQANK